MSRSKPEFHLQRVHSDGTRTSFEVYPLHALPETFGLTRRGFVGLGVSAASILALCGGCGDEEPEKVATTLSPPSPAAPQPPRAAPRPPPAASQPAPSGDNNKGTPAKTIYAHTDEVHALAVTPDGKLLASASKDKTVKLWSLPDGTLKTTLTGHESAVEALAITRDGKLLASGDWAGIIILWDLTAMKRRSYLFDPKASRTDAFVYNVKDVASGRTLSYTLPCGSAVPPGAVCTCNCVLGTYRPPASSGGNGTYCTCNTVCTCIPVCQAHRLLHPSPFVRTMAEQLLMVMGEREFPYMTWAAGQAEPALKARIDRTINAIRAGAKPDLASGQRFAPAWRGSTTPMRSSESWRPR
ncbi:MAG: WD40 repeat domain-containing protein [Isosphaerales bacterium]